MKWTTDKPTEPGWYFLKQLSRANIMVYVDMTVDGLWWADCRGFGKRDDEFALIGGIESAEWAGPIPLPED